ncbi:prepilin-type N-terminal cleavage/methylation domain-containing protein [Marinobacterium rhizophilum]|uniref:Prepilin-type N-terminal cleavage/methylation domain-containing protein n=1 Tax=Marinobacterium rhizophilum TaxID=420402 RepID=A0ABY5HFI2_9GAMM|nr:prepilin-type N-terminal cleavage/methylation domain-containing protein [Marinobacterium rhizophilum]UTW11115.1 prepilin-type N-terminal cleavage/methylation domain-containing protein [Marinobacterium rhizophilum]
MTSLTRNPGKLRSRGFTLIEVLISLIVAVIGIVAILQLQGVFLSTASDSQQRALATAVAEKKLEELRGFDSIATTSSSLSSFDAIDSGTGTETVTAGSTDYTFDLAWTVTPYAVSSGTVSLASAANAQFKNVTLNVSWGTGAANSLSLSSVIGAINPQLSKFIDKVGLGGETPQVAYTPGLAPDIIAIDLGDGTKKETSKPLPEVSQKGTSNIVKFEVVTYDTQYRAITEDFVTLNCVCKLAGTGSGLSPAKTIYNATTKSLETDYSYTPVTKQIGAVYNSGATNDQPDLCTRCCRDHHDNDSGTDNSYRWYWPGVGDASQATYFNTGTGDHRHYNSTDGITFTEAVNLNDIYRETCRFKRVDGIYRLMQDWKQHDITVMPYNYLASGATGNTKYKTYVTNYLDQLLTSGNFSTPVSVAKPTGRNLVSGEMGTVTQGSTTQLLSRSIYVDPLTSSAITAIQNIRAASGAWLSLVPFYEINSVLLSNWSSTNTTAATVANDGVVTVVDPALNYYGSYNRGLVSAMAAGTTSVAAASLVTNTGVIGHRDAANVSLATDGLYDTTVNQRTDGITVTVVGAGHISGTFSCIRSGGGACNGQNIPAYTSLNITANGTACTKTKQGNTWTWDCLVPTGWVGNVTFSYTGYTFKNVGSTDTASSPYNLSATEPGSGFDILITIP